MHFFQAFKKAESNAALSSLNCILVAAANGKWQAAAWLLERRYGYTRGGEFGIFDETIDIEELDTAELLAQFRKSTQELKQYLGPEIDLDD